MDQYDELIAPRYTAKDVTVHNYQRLFKSHFALDLYDVSYKQFDGSTSKILHREIFERDAEAVAILPFDPVTQEVVLIEQFRPGSLKDPVSPWLIEIVAGMIDKGETEIQAAVRELKEEAGLEITPDNLHYVNAVYPSPGGCSEKVTIYIGNVNAQNLLSKGGLDNECEDLRLFKMPAKEVFKYCENGRICNAMTLIGLMHLRIHYDEILAKFLSQKI